MTTTPPPRIDSRKIAPEHIIVVAVRGGTADMATTEQAHYAIVDALGRTLIAPFAAHKVAMIRAGSMERAGKVDPAALPLQVIRCTKSCEPREPSQ